MAPYIRIFLRYLCGYLVIKQVIPEDIARMIENDPELVALIGAGIAALVEGAYWAARKLGWRT